MFFRPNAKPTVVSQVGASANSVLCGSAGNNQGLRVRILESQTKGHEGPVQGRFVVLDTGDNRHSSSLSPFVGKVTNAQEILAAIRQSHPACVNVVNTTALTVEPAAAGTVSDPDGFASASAESPRSVEVVSDPDA